MSVRKKFEVSAEPFGMIIWALFGFLLVVWRLFSVRFYVVYRAHLCWLACASNVACVGSACDEVVVGIL